MGGQPGNGGNFPASTYAPLTGPYGQITLSQTGDAITVTGVTNTNNINFYDQTTEGGIFGFGPVAGTLAISGCMVNSAVASNQSDCTLSSGKVAGTEYDGYGYYANSVSISNEGTAVTGGDAFSQFAFTLTDSSFTSSDPAQLLNSSSPSTIATAGGIASDVCEDLLANGHYSSGCNTATGNNVEHTYVSVTPEPKTYLLFGSGLLALGIFLRKKQSQSASRM
jgi:hypothetical protein